MKKFSELTHQEIIEAIEEQETLASILSSLECHDNTSNRNKLKQFIHENNINISHIKIKLTRSTYEQNPKRCKACGDVIPYEKRQNDFCNHSCSASYNNQGVCRNGEAYPEHSYCLNCRKEITRGNKYCDNRCKGEYEYKQYIERWKSGKETGSSGTDGISARVRRYMFEKSDYCCQNEDCKCNWRNPYTGLSILQLHHINGDSSDNSESNLQVLCPNCHAMTENFGSRNENSSRIYRKSYRNL